MPRIKKLKSELACHHILVRKATKGRIFDVARKYRKQVADLIESALNDFEANKKNAPDWREKYSS